MSLYFANDEAAIIVGAAVTIAGATFGILVVKAPGWLAKARKKISSRRDVEREVGMGLILALEDLVGDCFAAAHDDPEFNPENAEEFVFHTPDPTLALPKSIDWSIFAADLANEVRWMPIRARNIRDGLGTLDISQPNYGDLFERRQFDYSRFGLRGLDLIERLSLDFDIPLPERPDYYNPRQAFEAKIGGIEARWNRRLPQAEKPPMGGSNVTPLFGAVRDDTTA